MFNINEDLVKDIKENSEEMFGMTLDEILSSRNLIDWYKCGLNDGRIKSEHNKKMWEGLIKICEKGFSPKEFEGDKGRVELFYILYTSLLKPEEYDDFVLRS